ncbi:hypothetical protein ACEPAF_9063 [Sanghuangporus sanghuang]
MILDWATILCVDYILYLRVRALYSLETRYSRVVMCTQILYLLNVIITLGSLIAVQIGEGVFPHAVSNGSGFCDSRKLLVGLRCLYWSAPLTYNSILMGLSFYKAASIQSSLGFQGVNLVRTVVVDQAIYFLLVIICSVANIVTNLCPAQGRSSLIFILNILAGAQLLCLQGSRMLIHLKKVSERRLETEASCGITTNITNPEFRTYTTHESSYSIRYSLSLGG